MIENYYSQLQFIVWVLLLITGSYLLIGKVPPNNNFAKYKKSRKIMGICFLVYFLQFFLQWKFNAREDYPLVASALNISLFYMAAILCGFSFISLLKDKYLTISRVAGTLGIWCGVSALIWTSIFFLPSQITKWILIASALWLFIYVAYLSWVFISTYKKAIKNIQNFYSEKADGFINWISKSVFFTITMGLLCSIMAFAQKWMLTLYLALSIPFFFYIFVRFVDYLINYEVIDKAIEDDNSLQNEPTYNSKLNTNLEPNLQEWIQRKEYLHPKINLGELAKQIGSNRSYLSNYINSVYQCTYYEWIGSLRIEEAKKLLLTEPNLTISEIADKVGFSSGSHFTSLFSEKENLSPTKYREKNRELVIDNTQV